MKKGGEPRLVMGRVQRVLDSGDPLVELQLDDEAREVVAQALADPVTLEPGCAVAVLLDPQKDRPLVAGRLELPGTERDLPERLVLDAESLVLEAEQELVLRCGKASITLTRDGRIVLRGTHVLQRSSGPVRIKGASVDIN